MNQTLKQFPIMARSFIVRACPRSDRAIRLELLSLGRRVRGSPHSFQKSTRIPISGDVVSSKTFKPTSGRQWLLAEDFEVIAGEVSEIAKAAS
jgi:hypothetical protein